ncbi:acyltransferase family protein [Achromobacter xylosoxidans]|nr:acyltransferase family protein [Achromobacter xylosoxidans]
MREHHLDGLRGWAYLFVVFSHLGPMFLLAGRNYPVMPFFWDGNLAVYVFFVLSGYVLSVGHFGYGRRADAALQAVRRYPRLTIPILVSCALALALQTSGLLRNKSAGLISDSPWLASFYDFEMSLYGLLQFAGWDVYVRYGEADSYNAVLWTMPFEMLGSLLIFAMLFLAGANRVIQSCAISAFIAWTAFKGSPLLAFALGMAVAFIKVTGASHRIRFRSQVGGGLLLVATLTISLYRLFGGAPVHLALYAVAILISVELSPALQSLLSTRLSKWLGTVSFPLYLTHLLVFCSLSSSMVLALANDGALTTSHRIVIGITSITVALIVAAAFEPIERLAIRASRAISSTVAALLPPGRRASPAEAPN